MRIPGLGGEILNRLGGISVNMSGGEVINSLKLGALMLQNGLGPRPDTIMGFQSCKILLWSRNALTSYFVNL